MKTFQSGQPQVAGTNWCDSTAKWAHGLTMRTETKTRRELICIDLRRPCRHRSQYTSLNLFDTCPLNLNLMRSVEYSENFISIANGVRLSRTWAHTKGNAIYSSRTCEVDLHCTASTRMDDSKSYMQNISKNYTLELRSLDFLYQSPPRSTTHTTHVNCVNFGLSSHCEGSDALVCWRSLAVILSNLFIFSLSMRWDRPAFNVCGDSCSLPSARSFSSRSLSSANANFDFSPHFETRVLWLYDEKCAAIWNTTKTTTNSIAKENTQKKNFAHFRMAKRILFCCLMKK